MRDGSTQSPEPEGSRARRSQIVLTLFLFFLVGLVNLYIYTVGKTFHPSPLAVGAVVSHAYYVALFVSAMFAWRGYPWAVWAATVLANFVYALVHPTIPGLVFVTMMHAGVGALTVGVIGRLRVRRSEYAADLERLDRANADVEKRLVEQSALFDVTRQMAQTFDIERLFDDAMGRLSSRLNMYRGMLSLYDPKTQELKIKRSYGLTEREIERGRYRLGEGIYDSVMASGEPMAIPNLGEEPIFLRAASAEAEALEMETRSVAFLCLPIVMEGATVGVLSVDRAPVDQRTLRDDLNFLTILASVFAQALKIQELIDEAVRQERLAVLGTMARSVAHEIRNPLGGIRGAAQLLEMNVASVSTDGQSPSGNVTLSDEAVEEARGYAEIIIQEVDRLNRVVEQLLHFGSDRAAPFEKVNLIDIVDRVLFLIASDAEAVGVNLMRIVPEETPPVRGDRDQLTQVFLNLTRNALDAMTQGGELRLIVRASEGESRGAVRGGAMRVVEVETLDTGPGVPEHLREEIFSPLYTTKQKGAGIGLALTKRIVEEHHGYIEVGGAAPRGARFTVVLPAIREA